MRKTSKASEASKTKSGAEPMDDSIREVRDGHAKVNHARVCYALETLVSEVRALFPETPVEYSNTDGRNTALDATFDLTTLDEDDRVMAGDLIMLTQADARVSLALLNHDPYYTSVLVSMNSNPRTQDSREPFGLADALDVLGGDDEDTWMPIHDMLAGNGPHAVPSDLDEEGSR